MRPRKIVLLGSTGSIGRSTLDVVATHPDRFDVLALAAYSDVDTLAEQARRFGPKYVCLVNSDRADDLKAALPGHPARLVFGEDELVQLAGLEETDMVVNAVVGAAGLLASLATVRQGGALALANKESLVAGGPLFPDLMAKTGAQILPIDSEHSALWQALRAGKPDEVRRLIITASGGPFREYPADKFAAITPQQALNHPTWKMGPKITIDSATLANKGLEVIEAVALFQVPAEKISVVVHPQSIIHSMVEFVDSSIIAQLSEPDMRLPITHALFWPERIESGFGRLDLDQLADLTFEPPDLERFAALRLAFEVARTGGTAPAIFNAANEIAVEAFLDRNIKFTDIPTIIEDAVNTVPVNSAPELEDVLEADRRARQTAREKAGIQTCC